MGDLEKLMPLTRECLEPLISKPKLSDKLLSKPPFRFMHDIVTSVLKATGFPEGLYEDDQLDSENVKEKDAKLDFLDRLIKLLSMCQGKEIQVQSSKIVSGLEPENTNVLLQVLGKVAADKSINFKKHIQKMRGGAGDEETNKTKEDEVSKRLKNELEDKAAEARKKEEEEERRQAQLRKERKEKDARTAAAAREEEERQTRQQAESAKKDESKEDAKAQELKQFERPPTRARSERSIINNKSEENGLGSPEVLSAQVAACDGTFEKTKELIEKIISKPKMATKLLEKPPFRFLHDVVMAVNQATGFANGLYDEIESDPANVKEKDSKINFLDKIIQCVGFHLGVQVEARSAKIVAGLEAGDTNKFLQLLAVAASSGNSSDAVRRTLSKDSSSVVPTTSNEAKAVKAVEKSSAKEVEPTSNVPKLSTPEPPAASKQTIAKSESEMTKADAKSDSLQPSNIPVLTLAMDATKVGAKEDEDEDADAVDIDAKRVARPTTARKRPPKLKENVKEGNRIDVKVAPPTGIMADGANDDSDGDDNEQQPQDDRSSRSFDKATSKIDAKKHGKLVRDILENQSKEEDGGDVKEDAADGSDKKSGGGIRLGRKSITNKSERKTTMNFTKQEVEELQMTVQKLCQATNPLGKCLEYVHEDMEAMTKELEVWRNEYRSKKESLEEERKETEEILQPLRLQLIEIEEQIKEQIQKIHSMKATIAKNDARTQQILRMVVSS